MIRRIASVSRVTLRQNIPACTSSTARYYLSSSSTRVFDTAISKQQQQQQQHIRQTTAPIVKRTQNNHSHSLSSFLHFNAITHRSRTINLATSYNLLRVPYSTIASHDHAASNSGRIDDGDLDLLLKVNGMKCGACVNRVEKAIKNVNTSLNSSNNLTIDDVNVNLMSGIAVIRLAKPQSTTTVEIASHKESVAKAVITALENLGYKTTHFSPLADETASPSASDTTTATVTSSPHFDEDYLARRRELVTSIMLGLPVFSLSMFHTVFPVSPLASAWIQLALTTPIVLYSGRHFFTRAWKLFVTSWRANMDTLIATGVGSAYSWSVFFTTYATFFDKVDNWSHVAHDAAAAMSAMPPIYFESAAVITALVLIGRHMEDRARAKTNDAVQALAQLAPKFAQVKRNGEFVSVPIRELKPNDIVLVQPGESISADGVVISGTSYVNQSMLTGEPIPVEKKPGALVTGGTLNSGKLASSSSSDNSETSRTIGTLLVRVTKTGENTTLSQIIRAVQMAQSSKLSRVQRIADTVAGYFAGFVMALALLTFLGYCFYAFMWSPTSAAEASSVWSSLQPAISAAVSVLVVSCPCALGLAIPTAIQVATGRAARRGILVRSASSLEQAAKIRSVVFDKTGTITEGRPRVTDFIHYSERSNGGTGRAGDGSIPSPAVAMDKNRLLHLVQTIEERSEHPYAKAIVQFTKEQRQQQQQQQQQQQLLHVENFVSKNIGIKARVDGHQVHIGTMKFFQENNIIPKKTTANDTNPNNNKDDPDDRALALREVEQDLKRLARQAKTPILLSVDNEVVGMFGLADTLKREAAQTLVELHRDLGMRLYLLTGDKHEVAEAIVEQIKEEAARIEGVQLDVTVKSEMSPEQKLGYIKELQERGESVAMVGEGINDSIALAQADVGIALGTGTDIAISSSDVVVLSGDVSKVSEFLALSRATMATIKSNLWWAFSYNLVGLPLAMANALNPMLASAMMSVSSLLVVGNSLRLKWKAVGNYANKKEQQQQQHAATSDA